MDLTANFTRVDLEKYIGEQLKKANQLIINELKFVGLNFVRNARIKADFTDRTGNLRSSIGFVILQNNQIVDSDFEPSNIGTDKETGLKRGFEYAYISHQSFQGIVLIVVAGMNYALSVEAKGYDVITGSSQTANQELQEAFKALIDTL